MSIRTDYRRILQDTEKESEAAKKQIMGMCINDDYTIEGRKNGTKSIQDRLHAYIEEQRKKVNKIAQEKYEGLEAFEESQLRHKNEDVQYQSLLQSTLSMLPLLVKNAKPEDLKARLKPFEDDPLAISAFKTVLDSTAAANGGGLDNIPNYDVLPNDNRGKKAARLKKLQDTMNRHLDNMEIHVSDEAFRGGSFANSYTITGGSYINATLDYIDQCDDEDCTVWEPIYAKADTTPDLVKAMSEQFNNVHENK